MKLHTYFRSSAAYRVRIALNLKGLDYEAVPVHLVRGGGEHRQPAYLGLHPAGLVPALEDQGQVLTQSLAIVEYLEETHPQPALLPAAALDRARVRAIAQAIACDIHPVNNLRVLQYLTRELGVSEEQKNAWYRHWVEVGLEVVERQLSEQPATGTFCHGDTPTMADCLLVPQIFNAQRFDCDLSGLPRTMAAFEACMGLEAFQKAQPSACPDFEA